MSKTTVEKRQQQALVDEIKAALNVDKAQSIRINYGNRQGIVLNTIRGDRAKNTLTPEQAKVIISVAQQRPYADRKIEDKRPSIRVRVGKEKRDILLVNQNGETYLNINYREKEVVAPQNKESTAQPDSVQKGEGSAEPRSVEKRAEPATNTEQSQNKSSQRSFFTAQMPRAAVPRAIVLPPTLSQPKASWRDTQLLKLSAAAAGVKVSLQGSRQKGKEAAVKALDAIVQDITHPRQTISKAKVVAVNLADTAVLGAAAIADRKTTQVLNVAASINTIGEKISQSAQSLAAHAERSASWADRMATSYQERRIARGVVDAFGKSFERTGAEEFSTGSGYTLKAKSVEDSTKIIVSRNNRVIAAVSLDQQGRVSEVATVRRDLDYPSLQGALRSEAFKASPEIETDYQRNVGAIALLARQALNIGGQAQAGDRTVMKGKSYTYNQDEGGTVTVSANGRGVILKQSASGEIVQSSLTQTDIAKFKAGVERTRQAQQRNAAVER